MSTNPEARICLSALAVSILGCGTASAGDVDKPALEEIVVTASKREENLQNVAVPVTVQSGQQLMDAGYTGLAEYANNVPSFSVSSYGTPGQSQVAVRGISSTGSIATVGTYVDDAPMGGSNGWVNAATTLLDMVPYDLERIELLRGPQGTLYGQGAMGGILKYVLKKPSSDKFEARVGADMSAIEDSSDVGYTVRGRVNTPLVEGKLGISVAGFYKDTPGYMDNLWTGEKDTNKASAVRRALCSVLDADVRRVSELHGAAPEHRCRRFQQQAIRWLHGEHESDRPVAAYTDQPVAEFGAGRRDTPIV